MEETDQNDVTQVVYTLHPKGYGSLVSQFRAGAAQFCLFDGLGSTERLTDINGAVTDSYLYKAFGLIQASSGTSVNPFRFVGAQGYYYDQGLISYYVRARYYLPGSGRFQTEDLVGIALSAANPYLYTGNNPINFIDPSGRQRQPQGCPQLAARFIHHVVRLLNTPFIMFYNWRIYPTSSIPTLVTSEGITVQPPELLDACLNPRRRAGPDLTIRTGPWGQRNAGFGWVYEIKPASEFATPGKRASADREIEGYIDRLNMCGVRVVRGICILPGIAFGTSIIPLENCGILYWTCKPGGFIVYGWMDPPKFLFRFLSRDRDWLLKWSLTHGRW